VEYGMMKGNSEEALSINSHLNIIRVQIVDAQLELMYKKIPITVETIKNKINRS
jgi:hypothetical protein